MVLHGIVPVTVTPMNEDGSPDGKGHEKFIEYLLKYPIGGLWAIGSAGESFLMTYENRLATAKMLAELVNGRTPILMGAADQAMSNIFKFFEQTADLDIAGYHVIPTDLHMNHGALMRFYLPLAERSPKPLWLYHNTWRGPALLPESVRELAQHPNVAGMKAGGFSLIELIRFSNMDSEDFQVIGAGGGQTIQLLSMGLKAHTASPASCFPDIFCELYSLWEKGKVFEAIAVQKRFLKLWSKIPVPPENSETSAHEKGVLEAMGICQRHVSQHFRPMTDEEMHTIRKVLKDEGYL